MKSSTKTTSKIALNKTKSKSKGKVNKKSQRIKDKETQKGLDSLVSASSIFADLQANKPETKKLEKEKKTLERKEKVKSANNDLMAQLENISAFSL